LQEVKESKGMTPVSVDRYKEKEKNVDASMAIFF
jgi:hypothetical protein